MPPARTTRDTWLVRIGLALVALAALLRLWREYR